MKKNKCEKIKYKDLRSAWGAAHSINNRRKDGDEMVVPYFCSKCNSLHLTHKKQKWERLIEKIDRALKN